MKWSWVLKGFSVVGIISGKIPAILADGKITIEEMTDLTKSILEVFDVPVQFDIPSELKGGIIAASLDQ